MGFILSVDHTEAFPLPKEAVVSFVTEKLGTIYSIDSKRFKSFVNRDKNVYCVSLAKYLSTGEILEESKYDTTAHKFFNQKYQYRQDINQIIPICKHFEKYQNMVADLKFDTAWFKPKYYKLYGDMATSIFSSIERVGIKVNIDVFFNHYQPKEALMSVKSDTVYTQYNLFTVTGRPSNSFNGINFSALNKQDGSRSAFIPANDRFIEFDFQSYHVRILAYHCGYSFDDNDIHTHLGKFYFGTDQITRQQYEESKALTFKLLYTDSVTKEIEDIPFFKKVKDFKESLWNIYKKKGYIESFLSKRPIRGITSKTQILPYVLQNYETERNILILRDILKCLEGKQTKLVLYNYDSFLFDYSKADGKQILCDIQDILQQDGYRVSCKYGSNYQEMKIL